jgi:hypothetical protein
VPQPRRSMPHSPIITTCGCRAICSTHCMVGRSAAVHHGWMPTL